MTSDPPAPAALRLSGKVLYIEDSEPNIEIIEAMLAPHPGIVMVKAVTGQQGIAMARSERPDLVLLDMHLPDIGGLEVVRALNEEIASGGLRVTLLTADTMSMDIIKAMSLGAYDYWVKPIQRRQFENGLQRALTGAPRRTLPARPF